MLLTFVLLVAGAASAGPPQEEPPAQPVTSGEVGGGGEAGAEPSGASSPETVGRDLVEEATEEAVRQAEPAPEEAPLGAKTAGVEEIVVTGVRLEDTLQSEPVSATTFGGDEIRSLRIQNIQDLADFTSNLEINVRSAASNPTLFIRGIGLKDYNANAAGAVSIYQDGININAPAIQLGQLFDVASVQVLRGPQGITGRNATAGEIRTNSVLPEDEFNFYGTFTYGNYNTVQAEGAVTLPLIDGLLSSRVAFTANFRDGTTENACANWNPQAHPEFQDTDRINGKGEKVAVESFLVNQETLKNEYLKDKIAGREFNTNYYELTKTSNNVGFVGTTRPKAILDHAAEIEAAGLEPIAKFLQTDQVCMFQSPGGIVTPQGEAAGKGPEGSYHADRTPQFEDFQGLKTHINNVDNWAARGILRLTPPPEGGIQPFAGTDWLLNFHGGQNRSDSRHLQMIGADAFEEGGVYAGYQNDFSEAWAAQRTGFRYEGVRRAQGVDPSPGANSVAPLAGSDPFVGWYNQDGVENLDAWGSSLKGNWEFGEGGLVTSLTGFEWYDRFIEDEGDANPLAVFPAEYTDSAYQLSQEFRAEGELGPLRWFGGLFFLYESLDASNFFPDQRNYALRQTFAQTLLSGAPYLGGTYQLTEELSVEGGLRYNIEHKDFQLETIAESVQEDAVDVPTIPLKQVADTWTGLTGGLTLVYAPTWDLLAAARSDALSFYAKYTRAMKGGHFNASATVAPGEAGTTSIGSDILPVKPEYIHAVEAGIKSTWLEDRLTINADAFYYWYQDYQVFDILNGDGDVPLPRLLNAEANVLGAEVDFLARPLPGLVVQGSFGYLDSEFTDFSVEKRILTQRGTREAVTFVYDGNPLIASPKFSFSAIVEQTLPLFGWGWLVPQYSASFRSKQYLDPQKLEAISQDPYWVHNARLAYRTPDERIEVALWVENFLDERYREDVFDLTRSYNSILEVWGDPRTFGVTLSYAW